MTRNDDEGGQTIGPVTRSSRTDEDLTAGLNAWLDANGGGSVVALSSPSSNGMSSETLLVDIGDGPRSGSWVARCAPIADDVPVFPGYDLERQRALLDLLRREGVAVPSVDRAVADDSWIGTEFFLMQRVAGRVPSDIPPYTFDGFLCEASADSLQRLEHSTVAAIAGLHSVTVGPEAISILGGGADLDGRSTLERHLAWWEDYHRWVCPEGVPLLDRGFAWLRENMPADPGNPVIGWGDARIGNILYDEHLDVAALLDWEMAEIAPRGTDLGWCVFFHTFFQDIAETFELAGLPGLLSADSVMNAYRELCGVEVADLEWYVAYAAVRHGAIMYRVTQRSVHFGEVEAPAQPEDAIIHRERLAELISE